MAKARELLTNPNTIRLYTVIPVLFVYLFIAGLLATIMDPIAATICSNVLVATLIGLWRYNYYSYHSNKTEITLRHNGYATNAKVIACYIIGILFAWVGAHTLTQVYMYFTDSRSVLGDILSESTNPTQIFSIILLITLVAPLCEEFVFRGFVQTVSQRVFPVWGSITLSTITFAIIHNNGPQIIFAVLIGALFGYIYAYTQRVRVTIILHMICNLAPFFMPIPYLVNENMTTTTAAIIVTIISLICYAIGAFIIYKATPQARILKPKINKDLMIDQHSTQGVDHVE